MILAPTYQRDPERTVRQGIVLNGKYAGYAIRIEDYGKAGCLVVYWKEGEDAGFNDWIASPHLLDTYLKAVGRKADWRRP